jgi:transcriptional regulator with XRE-family HTH domain
MQITAMAPSRAETLLRYVGANVRRLREARDWTQKDLADKADVSWRSVQDLERGSGNPTLKLLIAVAQALRVDPADLFAATKVEKREPGRPPEK